MAGPDVRVRLRRQVVQVDIAGAALQGVVPVAAHKRAQTGRRTPVRLHDSTQIITRTIVNEG